MQISTILLDQIRNGQVVLFLGAGASRDALHKENKQPPIGQQLADLLAEKFLGTEFRGRPLAQVAELATVRTDAPYVYRRMRGRHQADVLDGNQALSTRPRS